ncbi:MAG TPA: GlsB/YeaQ/YmgE family stress response membrane protein [Chthoniobacteraceae bacterium]|nr:GlsB/YeaQ/YmgE family stress response membrane protein [Chthoniobacteraceae bacterium]
MLHIIWSIIVGFIVGWIANHFIHTDIHGFWMTAGVGIAGSIVGGLIARLFSKPKEGQPFHPAGILMSIVGSVVLLLVLSKLGF